MSSEEYAVRTSWLGGIDTVQSVSIGMQSAWRKKGQRPHALATYRRRGNIVSCGTEDDEEEYVVDRTKAVERNRVHVRRKGLR